MAGEPNLPHRLGSGGSRKPVESWQRLPRPGAARVREPPRHPARPRPNQRQVSWLAGLRPSPPSRGCPSGAVAEAYRLQLRGQLRPWNLGSIPHSLFALKVRDRWWGDLRAARARLSIRQAGGMGLDRRRCNGASMRSLPSKDNAPGCGSRSTAVVRQYLLHPSARLPEAMLAAKQTLRRCHLPFSAPACSRRESARQQNLRPDTLILRPEAKNEDLIRNFPSQVHF